MPSKIDENTIQIYELSIQEAELEIRLLEMDHNLEKNKSSLKAQGLLNSIEKKRQEIIGIEESRRALLAKMGASPGAASGSRMAQDEGPQSSAHKVETAGSSTRVRVVPPLGQSLEAAAGPQSAANPAYTPLQQQQQQLQPQQTSSAPPVPFGTPPPPPPGYGGRPPLPSSSAPPHAGTQEDAIETYHARGPMSPHIKALVDDYIKNYTGKAFFKHPVNKNTGSCTLTFPSKNEAVAFFADQAQQGREFLFRQDGDEEHYVYSFGNGKLLEGTQAEIKDELQKLHDNCQDPDEQKEIKAAMNKFVGMTNPTEDFKARNVQAREHRPPSEHEPAPRSRRPGQGSN